MDNATEALKIAASVLVFVLALTLSMFLFRQLTETGVFIFEHALRPKYAREIKVADLPKSSINSLNKRIVTKNDVISALYRYPKETVAITILDKSGKELQVFDKNIEANVRNLVKLGITDPSLSGSGNADSAKLNRELLRKFNTFSDPRYLYGAPWIGDNVMMRQRVSYYIGGKKEYIDDVLVDYRGSKGFGVFVKDDQKFIETVIRYRIFGKGLYDPETDTEVSTTEIGTYKTELIYQAID